MFVFIGDDFKIAPKKIEMSHLEWFEKEGWVSNENKEEFLKENIRGLYDLRTSKLYFFKGYFEFDDELISEVKKNISKVKKMLVLGDEVEVNFGPVDDVINGKKYEKLCIGKLKDLL